jgi:hypothetical protein
MLATPLVAVNPIKTNPIKIILNGATLKSPLQPIYFQNHVYVPVKIFAEALGATVTWDSTKNAVVVKSKVNLNTTTEGKIKN